MFGFEKKGRRSNNFGSGGGRERVGELLWLMTYERGRRKRKVEGRSVIERKSLVPCCAKRGTFLGSRASETERVGNCM